MAFKATNIAGEVSVGDLTMSSQASAGAINGAWVKVNSATDGIYASALASGLLANVTGSPTAATLKLKIQDATDSSGTGAADYKGDGANVTQSVTGIAEGSPASGTHDLCKLAVNLKNARAYVRVVGTLAFTGGTSPKADVVVGLHMGGPTNLPVADQSA